MDSDDDPPRDVFSTSIEEPFIPEVKMKSSSWYEPEPDRIIVTSLELSDDEEEATDPDTTTLSIPPALLKQLMSQSPRDLRAPQIPPSRLGSQALVLFKPLPVSNIEEQASDKVEGIVKDDDAMDVEP
ncbi:hypothetical protein H0H87_007081 [Tephrocybe sp. NHM501043]|nr:hypothetical protein H0H87_007081 [Tephrocybe sp. NHM501043]